MVKEFRVKTLPVFSKLAEIKEIPTELANALPEGWSLSRHQVETYKALTWGGAEVIFNTAMTGDGKSLAAYLPVILNRGRHVFGMYPTIELSKDQARQFAGYQEKFRTQLAVRPLWGGELTRLYEAGDFRRRGDRLKELLDSHDVLLTNPDIFHLMMNFRYGSYLFNEDELPYSLATNFDYFAFDEFHIFNMPQFIAAITAMIYLRELYPQAQHRFLFYSATPKEILIEMIQRSGLSYQVIPGDYQYDKTSGYRQVLYSSDLSFHLLNDRERVEDWVFRNMAAIAEIWKSESARRPKGAFIVHSVATARRITNFLSSELGPMGISVGENTGLTDKERRRVALEKDIVVGTSTIDVGVDFYINFLVFEAANYGQFLQRLGRLGRVRHNDAPYDQYKAHALISGKTPWIYERLVTAFEKRGIKEGDVLERPTMLRESVEAAFPQETDFVAYAKRWGTLQAAHIVNVLDSARHRGVYASVVAAIEERFTRLFNLSRFEKARKRYWAIWNKPESRPILEEVLAFRGSPPFQVGVWDASVDPNAFLSYDAFPLIQGASYSTVHLDTFKDAVMQRFSEEAERQDIFWLLNYVVKGTGDRPLILRIDKFAEERGRLVLKIREDLSLFSDRVVVLTALGIAEPRTSPSLVEVNAVLQRQKIVCYATRVERNRVRYMLHLPAMFPLYTVQDVNGKEYTMAFGKDALLLEAQLLGFHHKNAENAPIIV